MDFPLKAPRCELCDHVEHALHVCDVTGCVCPEVDMVSTPWGRFVARYLRGKYALDVLFLLAFVAFWWCLAWGWLT